MEGLEDGNRNYKSSLVPRGVAEWRRAVQIEAYLNAERRGFLPGKEKEDWQRAERIVDDRVFGQFRHPRDLYAALMTKFFYSFMYENRQALEHSEKTIDEPNYFDFRNVSLLAKDTELSFLTRRASLITDSTLLSHATRQCEEYKYKNVEVFSDWVYDNFESEDYLTNCPPDLIELGSWLLDCQPLLEIGDVFYYPRVSVARQRQEYHPKMQCWEMARDEDHVYDAIISSRKLVEPLMTQPLKTDLIRTIVQVDLPFIDNVDLPHFSKISRDEHHYLEAFRDHWREQFLDIFRNEGSETFDCKLQEIGIRIRSGIRALKSDFNRLNQKAAIQAVGATIGSVTAILVAINSGLFAEVSSIVVAGGGLAAYLKILDDYVDKKSRLRDNPYYYLWLLTKS